MKEKKIAPKYIGSRFRIPTVTLCVAWLMMDRLEASPVVQAVVWTLLAVVVLGMMVAPFLEDHVKPRDV